VYYDSSQGLHRDLYYHPEQPARITQCLAAIRGMALTQPTSSDGGGGAVIQLIDCAPAVVKEETIQESSSSPLRRDDDGSTTTRRPEERRVPITADELAYAEQLLLQTHAPELVHNLKQQSRQAQAERLAKGKPVLGHVSNRVPRVVVCYCTLCPHPPALFFVPSKRRKHHHHQSDGVH
jgi:hypothetical protein